MVFPGSRFSDFRAGQKWKKYSISLNRKKECTFSQSCMREVSILLRPIFDRISCKNREAWISARCNRSPWSAYPSQFIQFHFLHWNKNFIPGSKTLHHYFPLLLICHRQKGPFLLLPRASMRVPNHVNRVFITAGLEGGLLRYANRKAS